MKRRGLIHALIASSAFALWLGLGHSGFLTRTELSTLNERSRFGRLAPINPNIVFLAIDAPSVSLETEDALTIEESKALSLMKMGWPFPHEVYGEICKRLLNAGARVIGFDIIFPSPKPGDSAFRQTLEVFRDRTVIGFNFPDNFTTYNLPPASLLPSQDPTDEQVGYFNYWPDEDGVIRNVHYRTNLEFLNSQIGADKLPMDYSLAARIVERAGYPKLVPNDMEEHAIRFANTDRVKIPGFSLYQIFVPHFWEKNFQNGNFFKDKMVLVGPEGNWSKDVLPTAWGNMAGAEIHLNAINALLQNEFLYPASDVTVVLLVTGSGILAFLLAMGIPSVASRFMAVLFIFGGYIAALMWAYNGPGWLLPAVGPIGVFCGAAGLGFIYDFVLTQVEKLQLRATFERYTSPNEAKYLLDHMDSYKEMLVGTRKPITILFSDIRGFTTMTEKADSQELVIKLNEYLTAMVECVFRYDGSLDKFIGDAVVGAWGKTPYNFGPKEDAARAVRAALAMMRELHRLNAKWITEGREEWHIGIGLNHGEVIVGDIGSQKRKEFAVIGDAVNLAARLESLTKEYDVDILIGESVVELVHDQFHFQTVRLVQVKGKTEAVDTFTVLSEKSEALSSELQQFLPAYEEGIRAFRSREFLRAKELFERALQICPDDHLAGQYLISCEVFIKNPPDATWNGVEVMTKK